MKRREKIVFGILALYIVFMLGLFIINGKKEEKYSTMFYDNYVKLLYKDGKWSNISNRNINDYSWKKYDLYYNNDFYGNYYLMYNNKWYIFDDDKKSIDWEPGIVAFSGNIKSRVIDTKKEDISSNEYSYSREVLSSLDIDNIDISKLKEKSRYLVDVDSDGDVDKIYSISNAQMEGDYVSNKTFTVVFARVNDKNIIIYKNVINKKNYYAGYSPNLVAFSIDDYKEANLLLSVGSYSDIDTNSYLYKYNTSTKKFDNILNK